MKNLANCKPSEFLKQTNRIRKVIAKYLKDTKFAEIRKQMPDIPEDATSEEERALIVEQGKKNINAWLDIALEEYPDETLEVLGLLCFVEKEDVDNYEVADYLSSFNEIIGNQAVVNFFTSLMRLAETNI